MGNTHPLQDFRSLDTTSTWPHNLVRLPSPSPQDRKKTYLFPLFHSPTFWDSDKLTRTKKRLGNLDLAIILETCLKDTGDDGGPSVRKLSSTATCWPGNFARFRWMLRGEMMVQTAPRPPSSSPPQQQQQQTQARAQAQEPSRCSFSSLRQRIRGNTTVPQPHTGHGNRRWSLKQRVSWLLGRSRGRRSRPGVSGSRATEFLQSAGGNDSISSFVLSFV